MNREEILLGLLRPKEYKSKIKLYCNSFPAPENLIQKGGIKLKNGKGIVKIELNKNESITK